MNCNNIENLVRKIRERNPKRILLQIPEGIKHKSIEIIEAIESKGIEVIFSVEPCYGACDLPLEEARNTNPDMIVHIGHKQFYRSYETEIPVLYFEWPLEITIDKEKLWHALKELKEEKIGVVTSVQYLHYQNDIKKILENEGKTVKLGGYVLGCWTPFASEKDSKDLDAIIFAGSGTFHAFGFNCDYFLDLEKGELREIRQEIEQWNRKYYARIVRAKEANSFGILISTKQGQKELLGYAYEIKNKLEQRNKKAFILIMDDISDQKLQGIKVDAFINTACPRMIDDMLYGSFKYLIINANDLDKVLDSV